MSDGKIVIDTLLDSNGIQKGLKSLGGITGAALKGVGLAVAGVSAAFLGVGAYAIKVGSDFEAAMSKVGAISGASAEDMVKLSDKAKQMGIDTKFSATESATALQFMAMAGWKTNDMLQGLPGIMNLAAASGEELGSVSDIVTDALTAFGMKASESAHFADVLAQASSNSNTNVAMLGESFKYVAPLAGALGYSAEDTSIALGLMANSGIKASQAGTSLKTGLVNMVKPTKKMKAVMDEYGLSLTNADGTMKPLSGVMEELRTKMGGLDKATQAAAAATLFGKESLAGMLSVINASPADYKKLSDAINNADGAADKMAKTMGNNLQGKITLIKSSLEGLGIQIYEKMKKPLTEAAETAIVSLSKLSKSLTSGDLAGSVDKIALGFANLMKSIAEGIVTWLPKIITAFAWIMDNSNAIATGIVAIGSAMIAMNIGNAVVAFIGLVKEFQRMQAIMPGLTAAQWLFDAAVAACGGPAVLIAALIIGLIAALVYLWNTNEGFRTFWIGVWQNISDFFVGVWTAIIGFFTNTIPTAFNSFIAIVSALPGQIGAFFTTIYNNFLTWGAGVLTWVTTTFSSIVTSIVTFFSGLPGQIGAFFTTIYNNFIAWGMGVITWITGVFTSVLASIVNWGTSVISWVTTTIPLIINSIMTFFNELPGKLGYALGFALGTIISWGVNTWNYLVTNVPIWINAVVTFFSQLPGRIWTWLVSAYTNIVTWGSQVYVNMSSAISRAINAVITWFSQLPGRIWTWLVNAYTKVVTWGSQVYSNMSSAISRAISAVVTFFSQLPGKIWTWLSNAISKIVSWGSQMYSNMSSAASRAISAAVTFFSQLPGKLWSHLSSALSKMAQFATNLGSKAKEAGSNMVSNIMSTIGSLPGKMASIGGDIVKGIWNGMSNMGGWMKAKVSDFAGGILQGMKDALDINSPSRVMRDQIGKFIPRGIGVGIDNEMPNLQKGMDKNMSGLVAKMKGTVDYETAKTTAGVAAQHNFSVTKDTPTTDTTSKTNSQPFIIENKLIVDGKEFTANVTAPNQEQLDKWRDGR